MLWLPDAQGTQQLLWSGHACSGYRTLWEHARYYGLGIDALGTGCIGNTKAIVVWACMLWLSYALGTRTLFLSMDALVTGCTGNTKVILVWACMLWLSYALGTRALLCFGHGCSRDRMLWEHERFSGSGMDALVLRCIQNTNVIIPLPPTPPSETSQNRVQKSPRLLKHGHWYIFASCDIVANLFLNRIGTLQSSNSHLLFHSFNPKLS